MIRKAEGAPIPAKGMHVLRMPLAGILAVLAEATSTRQALKEGAFCLQKGLACDLEPMAPEARH